MIIGMTDLHIFGNFFRNPCRFRDSADDRRGDAISVHVRSSDPLTPARRSSKDRHSNPVPRYDRI